MRFVSVCVLFASVLTSLTCTRAFADDPDAAPASPPDAAQAPLSDRDAAPALSAPPDDDDIPPLGGAPDDDDLPPLASAPDDDDHETGTPSGNRTRSAPSPAAAAAATAAQSPWRFSVGGGLSLSLGTSPGRSFGPLLHVDIGYRAFRVQFSGRYELGASTTASVDHASIRLAGADLALCGTYTRFFGCGLGFLGSHHVTVKNSRDEATIDALYFAVGARLGYEAQFEGQWSLRIVLDGVVPTTRTRFMDGAIQLWRTPVVAGTMAFLVMYTFE